MLPITRVVLFKHGVGYFQRTGTVEGKKLIELGFKAKQMNDVLKSLTTLDYGGGTFAALSYDSEEPIERRLSELNMEIPEGGAISAFLDRLKGAQVKVPRGTGTLSGVVVGIEQVQRAQGERTVTEPHLALLADEGRLVRVPLLEIEELTFVDESIRRDLQSLLDILFSSLRKDRKRLSIQAVGQSKRKVSISYVIEAPVWKTSYRIVLPGEPDEKPLVQGWALVDNTTEDDWKAVELSLVAGLPISFIHDLYTPRYRQRPIVQVQEEAAVAPPVVEAGLMRMEEACEPECEEMDAFASGSAGAMPMRAKRMSAPMAPAPSMADTARSSVQVHTRTQEVGDLFAYEITQPVDVGRGRSALVPILQAESDAERVVLYNPEIREKNPMTAFRIKNTTGLTLEGGPVTVFEGDAYVGEAMLDTMRRDDERITPYSVELGVVVKRDSHTRRENVTRVSKHGQYIYKHYRQLLISEYEFHSRLDRDLTAYLDHRFSYDVREDTPEPAEITDSFWRFKLALAGKKATAFAVTEISEQSESIHIPGIARREIQQLVKNELIPAAVRAALEAIADQAEAIARLEEERSRQQEKLSKIESGQKRLRENLKSLGNSSEEAKLRQKYVAKLATEEEQIEALRTGLEALEAQIQAEREALEKQVDGLKV
jgi:hypothetical protein